VNDIAHASDGPGLDGSQGDGTWVESKFSLFSYRGRRLRLRFLTTTIEVGTGVTVEQVLGPGFNPNNGDDGWYIDDVTISNTLSTPAVLAVDTLANAGLPACGTNCSTLTPALVADPTTTGAPGQVVELNASTSTSDRCVGGLLQFQFWIDANTNGTLSLADGDTLLRDWTDNPVLLDAPNTTTTYGVFVRCTSLPSGACLQSTTTAVTVPCPSPAGSGVAKHPFLQTIKFEAGICSGGTRNGLSCLYDVSVGPCPGGTCTNPKARLTWPAPATIDMVRGDLLALRTSPSGGSGTQPNDDGTFNGSIAPGGCLANSSNVNSVVDATAPAVGQGFYYLVRYDNLVLCNSPAQGAYSTKAAREIGFSSSPAERDAEIALDADHCSP
jgi:hypothetical protein